MFTNLSRIIVEWLLKIVSICSSIFESLFKVWLNKLNKKIIAIFGELFKIWVNPIFSCNHIMPILRKWFLHSFRYVVYFFFFCFKGNLSVSWVIYISSLPSVVLIPWVVENSPLCCYFVVWLLLSQHFLPYLYIKKGKDFR